MRPTIGDKIRKIRKMRGISQKDFAQKIGISYGALQSYEYGTTEPKPVIINTIASIFGIDVSYFYGLDESSGVNLISPQPSESKIVNLFFYGEISASAGYGALNDNENAVLVPVSEAFLLNVLKVPAIPYDIIKVSGDSMEPFIKDGDMVLIERDVKPANGDIIVANIADNLYVKKFLIDPIKNCVKLTSLNDFYQDIIVEGSEIEQIKVIGRVRARFNMHTGSLGQI